MKILKKIIFSTIGLALLGSFYTIFAEELLIKPAIQEFILYMHKSHKFNLDTLNSLFTNYIPNQEVLYKISNPSEKLSWGKYKQLLISKERIAKGKEFLIKYKDVLLKAEAVYGVPKELIVAILGVESFYGEHTGKIPIISSLTTLSFDYPPRAKFFKKELEEFLLLTQEEKIDPTTLQGSYAGAFSPAQFIPSSYRNYAVDFANIGNKNLNDMQNAIGSIANYLYKHGWKKEQPIATIATVPKDSKKYLDYIEKDLASPRPKYDIHALKAAGIKYPGKSLLPSPVTLMEFIIDHKLAQVEYWIGFNNFYVITRYNHSSNYAMVIHQLALMFK